jgi:hypothetical protein
VPLGTIARHDCLARLPGTIARYDCLPHGSDSTQHGADQGCQILNSIFVSNHSHVRFEVAGDGGQAEADVEVQAVGRPLTRMHSARSLLTRTGAG